MKPEAQRIAIAEACGYVNVSVARGECYGFKPGVRGILRPPDYLNDLNAIYEAEKILVGDYAHGLNGRDASARFHDELISVTTCDGFFLVHATAAQRCEAFLRTLSLWDDSK